MLIWGYYLASQAQISFMRHVYETSKFEFNMYMQISSYCISIFLKYDVSPFLSIS